MNCTNSNIIVMESLSSGRFHKCVKCGHQLPPSDQHNLCVQCLGIGHARAATNAATPSDIKCVPCSMMQRRSRWDRLKRARLNISNLSKNSQPSSIPSSKVGSLPGSSLKRKESEVKNHDLQSLKTFLASKFQALEHRIEKCEQSSAADSFSVSPVHAPLVLHTSEGEALSRFGVNESSPKVEENEPSAAQSQELSLLMFRAAKALGIQTEAVHSPTTDPLLAFLEDTKPAEQSILLSGGYLDRVKSCWRNPASGGGPDKTLDRMYRVTESQAKAFGSMPSAQGLIFRAIEPLKAWTSDNEPTCPSKEGQAVLELTHKTYALSALMVRLGGYQLYLANYQAKLLEELYSPGCSRSDFIRLELTLITKHMMAAALHTGETAGRAMASTLATKRQVWVSQTNCPETVRADIVDSPIIEGLLFGSD